jgi:hypothetical protein
VPEVSETLAKLQLPPDLHQPPAVATSAVPLPKRSQTGNNQHQIALLIREGRRAAQELVSGIVTAGRDGEGDLGNQQSISPTMDVLTSVSTVLEKDFTVEGKKGILACPFSAKLNQDGGPPDGAGRVDGSQDPAGVADPTPHKSSDPICAAMLDESADPSVSAPKCPIRFLDKHSPEEIARYVETHKHAIPRSHEVCVRRYQRNEEQIRKLDAKYGSLVNMVQDLSHLHRPMMPPSKAEQQDADRTSAKRVEDWTQAVVAGDPEPDDEPAVEEEREGRFDRPMRDVRVGESPSRPWGISVPFEAAQQRAPSPPRPVEVPAEAPKEPAAPRKCPFDHTKMFPGAAAKREDAADVSAKEPITTPKTDAHPLSTPQPTFVNLPEMPAPTGEMGDRPQVVFNISGPVFIGYPMEQAIEFMKQLQGQGR